MKVEDALRHTSDKLAIAGCETAALDASVLLSKVTGFGKLELITCYDTKLSNNQQQKLEELTTRRINNEPIAYIVGEKEFWGLKFKVTPDVLIPRPDTETMVASLLVLVSDAHTKATIVDLGTGSGAILISILSEFPNMQGIGIDISEKALKIATYNAKINGIGDRINFIKGSWATPLDKKVNIIVSNPPYIKKADILGLSHDVQGFEPSLALDGGDDGLECYGKLIPECYDKLITGGMLMLEVGYDQAGDVKKLLPMENWAEVTTFKDIAGRERVIAAIKK